MYLLIAGLTYVILEDFHPAIRLDISLRWWEVFLPVVPDDIPQDFSNSDL